MKIEGIKKASYYYEALIKNRQRLTLPGVILVPSALAGLTALFGMGRGDPRRYSHLKVLSLHVILRVDYNFFDSIGKRAGIVK